MINKKSIEGNRNFLVGGDLLIQLSMNEQVDVLRQIFAITDQRFKNEVSESGQIFRISKTVKYSSESLFTSLMQIGLPANVALNIPRNIVSILKDIADQKKSDELLSTTDLRIAVVRAIEDLSCSGLFTPETTSIWATAYIRRYGNPDNEFVKVVDYGNERDLNYEYIQSTLLPHLLNRILGLPREAAPIKDYHTIFSRSRVEDMSKEIMRSVNTLNLYTISYKTILYLIQDIILEPPHPWIVSESTLNKVVKYNIERMGHHFEKMNETSARENLVLHQHSFQEYFRHACAAILSMYGAFLGVGNRYGLVELIRILKMNKSNTALWSYCRIQCIDNDLQSLGYSTERLLDSTNRSQGLLNNPSADGKYLKSLLTNAKYLNSLVLSLQDKLNVGKHEI